MVPRVASLGLSLAAYRFVTWLDETAQSQRRCCLSLLTDPVVLLVESLLKAGSGALTETRVGAAYLSVLKQEWMGLISETRVGRAYQCSETRADGAYL